MTEAVRAGRSACDGWGRLPRGYERRLQEIDGQGTYWHLFCAGERVNGGLADSECGAVEESRRLAWVHYWFDGDRPGRVPRSGEEPFAWEWGWDD